MVSLPPRSGLGLLPMAVQRVDAFLMLLLTLVVTPANVYMATHDAQMEGAPPMKIGSEWFVHKRVPGGGHH